MMPKIIPSRIATCKAKILPPHPVLPQTAVLFILVEQPRLLYWAMITTRSHFAPFTELVSTPQLLASLLLEPLLRLFPIMITIPLQQIIFTIISAQHLLLPD